MKDNSKGRNLNQKEKRRQDVLTPYHIYSMRQAIEERFILDVLQNYMTYKMYYKDTGHHRMQNPY